MTTFDQPAQNTGFTAWVSRSEFWLDGKGKGAWIAAMVLGFIVFWPVGLALLAYMIWSNKMSCKSSRRSCRRHTIVRTSPQPATRPLTPINPNLISSWRIVKKPPPQQITPQITPQAAPQATPRPEPH